MQRFGLHANDPFVQSNRCMTKNLCLHLDIFSFFAVFLWTYSLHMLGEKTAPPLYYAVYLLLCRGLCKADIHSTYCRAYCFIQKATLLFVPIFLYVHHWETPASVILVLWSGLSPLSAVLHQKKVPALLWLGLYVLCMIGVGGVFCVTSPPFQVTTSVRVVSYLNSVCVMLCLLAVVQWYLNETRKNILLLLIQYRNNQMQTLCNQNILANLFPKKIVAALQSGQKEIIEHTSYANIMVVKMVPLANRSGGIHAKNWLSMMHPIVSSFDELTTQLGVEKIKTTGDTYLAIGYPEPSVPHTTDKMLWLALGFRTILQDAATKQQLPWGILVGIASGEVSAGILGTKTPTYEVWGETVHIASQLSQHGQPGSIWLDERTKHSVHRKDFLLGPAQSIHIGPHTTIQAYAVLGTPQKQQGAADLSKPSPVQPVKTGTGSH